MSLFGVFMKLDLLNSRPLPKARDYRIYDSIEGERIPKISTNAAKYDLANMSFNSTGLKIDYGPKNVAAPNIFDRAKIDNKGNYVEVCNLLYHKPGNSSPLKHETVPLSSSSVIGSASVTSFLSIASDTKSKRKPIYTPSLDIIKDKIYNPNHDTVVNRIKGGKLPGALWSEMDRDVPIRSSYTGEDNLDKFRHERGKYGLTQTAVKFNLIPTGRGELASREDKKMQDNELLPLKVKMRLERMAQTDLEKEQRVLERKLKVTMSSKHINPLASSSSSVVSVTSTTAAANDEPISPSKALVPAPKSIKFSEASRFESPFYRQERYVKTSGMLLDNIWDKKLDKRISNGFSRPPVYNPKARPVKALGSDVDVDVGHLYSTEHTVKISPVKYSSAFRSKAAVGMEIRPTTSPAHIGPGTFADAYPTAININNPDFPSLPFLRDRKFEVRQAGPEKSEKIKIFSEQHPRGPVFTKQGLTTGNAHMENLVRMKMTQIYPRMAHQKFPQEKHVVQTAHVKRK